MASFIPRFLRQLRDIVIASPTDGQVLTYDSVDGKWKNEVGGGGSGPPTGAAGGVLGGTYPNPGFAADMATQAELDAHVNDTTDAHDASAVSFVPTGTIAATNVQAAIAEVATEAGGFPDESGDGSPGFNSLDPTTRPIGHIYLDSTNGGLFGIFLNPSSGLHEWFQFGGEVAGDVFHEGFNTGNGIAVLGDTLPGGDRSATMSDVDGYNGSGNGFHWCTTGVDGEQFAVVVTGPVGTPKFVTFGGSGGPGGLALDGDLDMSSGGDAFFTSTGKKVFTRVIDIREVTAPAAAAANHGQLFVQDNGSGVSQLCVRFETGDIMVLANQGVTNQTYTESNVTTDRTYNANATTIDELSDVLGTLIADLRAKGVVA